MEVSDHILEGIGRLGRDIFTDLKKAFDTVSHAIRRESDYIIGLVTPAIGTQYAVKVERKGAFVACEAICVVFHSNFAAYIVYRRNKPCEFLGLPR